MKKSKAKLKVGPAPVDAHWKDAWYRWTETHQATREAGLDAGNRLMAFLIAGGYCQTCKQMLILYGNDHGDPRYLAITDDKAIVCGACKAHEEAA